MIVEMIVAIIVAKIVAMSVAMIVPMIVPMIVQMIVPMILPCAGARTTAQADNCQGDNCPVKTTAHIGFVYEEGQKGLKTRIRLNIFIAQKLLTTKFYSCCGRCIPLRNFFKFFYCALASVNLQFIKSF